MSLPRMSWHIGDYKKDTGHLRAAGHGAYILLCMHYWATGGLPDDDNQLSAIACMTDREWKQHRSIIEKFFLPGWRHKRIDKELEVANAKYQKRAKAGSEGGKAKANAKQKPSNATANDIANAYQPITDNREKKKDSEPIGSVVCVPSTETSLGFKEVSAEKSSGRRKRKTALPENFEPDREVARKLGWPDHRIDQQIQAFFDSACAHNRQYADWPAAWRNWVNSPYQQQANGNGKRTVQDAARDLHHRVVERLAEFGHAVPDGDGDEAGGNPPRLLPQG